MCKCYLYRVPAHVCQQELLQGSITDKKKAELFASYVISLKMQVFRRGVSESF